MTAVGVTPSDAVVAEDVRDLQQRASHGGRPLSRRPLLRQGQAFERAHDGAQRVGGDLGIARRRVQLCMAERTRVNSMALFARSRSCKNTVGY
jgi:hypothetical protein